MAEPTMAEATAHAAKIEKQLYDTYDLMAVLSVSRATIWRLVRTDGFPPPIKLGPQSSRWPRKQVEAWIDRKIEEVSPEAA